MNVYLISYSTSKFRLSQLVLGLSARVFGCNKVIVKTKKDLIPTDFYKAHEPILSQKRGAGYWLWKYYFINELIHKINDNDIIIYADSGLFFKGSINPLIEILTQKTKGILLFNNNYLNRYWTKRDCFVKLSCDEENYYNSPLIFGGLQLFQKNAASIAFIEEVLRESVLDNIITDSPNIFGLPNLDGFIEHRHDQSVVSLIAHKKSIQLYPDPSQYKTKDFIYKFPDEYSLSEPLYKNSVYVHRSPGLRLLLLPFKILLKKA